MNASTSRRAVAGAGAGFPRGKTVSIALANVRVPVSRARSMRFVLSEATDQPSPTANWIAGLKMAGA